VVFVQFHIVIQRLYWWIMIGMGMCLQNRLGEVSSEVAGRRMDFVCASGSKGGNLAQYRVWRRGKPPVPANLTRYEVNTNFKTTTISTDQRCAPLLMHIVLQGSPPRTENHPWKLPMNANIFYNRKSTRCVCCRMHLLTEPLCDQVVHAVATTANWTSAPNVARASTIDC
jgi:hypothetical protein